MKKILISLMTLVLVVGMVGAGAFAYFSDTETSENNTFTAGTLDLTLTESMTTSFSLPPGMKPGDTASGTITVTNVGSLPGSLYATSWYVETDGNAPTEFSANMSADDVAKMLLITAFTADGVSMPLSIPGFIPDVDGDSRITVYDFVNDTSGGSLPGYADPIPPTGAIGGTKWYSYDANMAGGAIGTHIYVMNIQFDPLAGNDYQNDGITLTIEFLLTQ